MSRAPPARTSAPSPAISAQQLGRAAYLGALRRTGAGPFTAKPMRCRSTPSGRPRPAPAELTALLARSTTVSIASRKCRSPSGSSTRCHGARRFARQPATSPAPNATGFERLAASSRRWRRGPRRRAPGTGQGAGVPTSERAGRRLMDLAIVAGVDATAPGAWPAVRGHRRVRRAAPRPRVSPGASRPRGPRSRLPDPP